MSLRLTRLAKTAIIEDTRGLFCVHCVCVCATRLAMTAPNSARATPTVFVLVKRSVRATTLNRYVNRADEFAMMVLLVTLAKKNGGCNFFSQKYFDGSRRRGGEGETRRLMFGSNTTGKGGRIGDQSVRHLGTYYYRQAWRRCRRARGGTSGVGAKPGAPVGVHANWRGHERSGAGVALRPHSWQAQAGRKRHAGVTLRFNQQR